MTTRLEVTKRMYDSLFKLNVGTNVIKAEAGKIVREKMSGPSGHRLVVGPRMCETQRQVENEEEDLDECSPRQCWRDVTVVKRLVGLRRKIVGEQWRKAKDRLKEEMTHIRKTCSKKSLSQAWVEVHNTRRETWSKENPKHQTKVSHLVTRANNCNKHKMCRQIDDIWALRIRVAGTRRSTTTPAENDEQQQREKVEKMKAGVHKTQHQHQPGTKTKERVTTRAAECPAVGEEVPAAAAVRTAAAGTAVPNTAGELAAKGCDSHEPDRGSRR